MVKTNGMSSILAISVTSGIILPDVYATTDVFLHYI